MRYEGRPAIRRVFLIHPELPRSRSSQEMSARREARRDLTRLPWHEHLVAMADALEKEYPLSTASWRQLTVP